MAAIEKFEDLRIWQEARATCKWFSEVVKNTDLKTDYKLRNQADGSSGSVKDNIAEGFDRDGNKEFHQFLSIAKASSAEFRSQLYRIYDRDYVDEPNFNETRQKLLKLTNGIAALMKHLRESEFRGKKIHIESRNYSGDPNTELRTKNTEQIVC